VLSHLSANPFFAEHLCGGSDYVSLPVQRAAQKFRSDWLAVGSPENHGVCCDGGGRDVGGCAPTIPDIEMMVLASVGTPRPHEGVIKGGRWG